MRKKIEINTVSYVHVGDQLVRFDDLSQEQKAKAATALKLAYLNAMFQGKAKFYVAQEDEGGQLC